ACFLAPVAMKADIIATTAAIREIMNLLFSEPMFTSFNMESVSGIPMRLLYIIVNRELPWNSYKNARCFYDFHPSNNPTSEPAVISGFMTDCRKSQHYDSLLLNHSSFGPKGAPKSPTLVIAINSVSHSSQQVKGLCDENCIGSLIRR